jgi:hypothetical protein
MQQGALVGGDETGVGLTNTVIITPAIPNPIPGNPSLSVSAGRPSKKKKDEAKNNPVRAVISHPISSFVSFAGQTKSDA